MRGVGSGAHLWDMDLHWRRLPHAAVQGRPVFLTWRLKGSLPAHRRFPVEQLGAGRVFAAMDRLLDGARTGPRHLARPEVAQIVADALAFNGARLGQYELLAWVVMPNHVHALVDPRVELAVLTKSLKGITARRANEVLGTTGESFWEDESFDRVVRGREELVRVWRYIEMNPVSAGLVGSPELYRWSSAYEGSGSGPVWGEADRDRSSSIGSKSSAVGAGLGTGLQTWGSAPHNEQLR